MPTRSHENGKNDFLAYEFERVAVINERADSENRKRMKFSGEKTKKGKLGSELDDEKKKRPGILHTFRRCMLILIKLSEFDASDTFQIRSIFNKS